jgi:hypothetical protein
VAVAVADVAATVAIVVKAAATKEVAVVAEADAINLTLLIIICAIHLVTYSH